MVLMPLFFVDNLIKSVFITVLGLALEKAIYWVISPVYSCLYHFIYLWVCRVILSCSLAIPCVFSGRQLCPIWACHHFFLNSGGFPPLNIA
jgi:hypothetical protein